MMKLLAVAVILLASASITFGQAAGGGAPGPSSGGPPTGAASNCLNGTYPGPGLSSTCVVAGVAGQNINPAIVTTTSLNRVQTAEGAPSTCTTNEGSFTHQGDCAFFQAYDLAVSTGNPVDLTIGDNRSTGGLSACAEWTEPTSGYINVNIIGTSMNGSYIIKACSTPTLPVLAKTAGDAFFYMRNISIDANNNASSCYDLTGGMIGGQLSHVACVNVLPTATSGSDHMASLGSSGSYAEDLDLNYLLISPPYSLAQTYAAITGTLTGTSLTALSCGGSCGSYGAPSYAVGIVNDPNHNCSVEPTFSPVMSGNAISSFTITAAGTCTSLPDFQVIQQVAITYGLKAYLSDSIVSYLEPNAGITGAYFPNEGGNTFYHAHPTSIQYGMYFNDAIAAAAVIDGTECDTISTWCLGFVGTGGKTISGTFAAIQQNLPGASVYYLASGVNNLQFGAQGGLCGLFTTPSDYRYFLGPTGTLIPGGTGWPSGSSIQGNDQSCTAVDATQQVNYTPISYSGLYGLPGGFFNFAGFGTFLTGFSVSSAATAFISGGWQFVSANTATSSNNYPSVQADWGASYWNGAAASSDFFGAQNVCASGTNPACTFTISHVAGSPGTSSVSFSGLPVSAGPGTFTSAAIGGSQFLTSVQGTAGTKLPAASGTFTNGNLRSTNSTGDEVDSGIAASTVGPGADTGLSAGIVQSSSGGILSSAFDINVSAGAVNVFGSSTNLAYEANDVVLAGLAGGASNFLNDAVAGDSTYTFSSGKTQRFGVSNSNSVVQIAATGLTAISLTSPIFDSNGSAPTYTPGTGIASVVCASGHTCTQSRGELTITNTSATTGTIATLNFAATLASVPECWVIQNGGVGAYVLGHGTPTTAGFTISAGLTLLGVSTVTVDYGCQL